MFDSAYRSLLFVPGDRPERFAKAHASGADGVIIDLEDAVAPERKALARAAFADAATGANSVLVRINAITTHDYPLDREACQGLAPAGVLLPKTESPEQIAQLQADGVTAPILPIIETARGYQAIESIAAALGVARLVFGTLDFQLDLNIPSDDSDELQYFRAGFVLASRLAGLLAPIDGVTTAIDNADRLNRDIDRGQRLGFGGKLCIHPRQVEAVNDGFGVGDAQIQWAQRVLEAVDESGHHAVAVDGKMVDAPVIERARRILAQGGMGYDR